jgi:hypothetical protein
MEKRHFVNDNSDLMNAISKRLAESEPNPFVGKSHQKWDINYLALKYNRQSIFSSK